MGSPGPKWGGQSWNRGFSLRAQSCFQMPGLGPGTLGWPTADKPHPHGPTPWLSLSLVVPVPLPGLDAPPTQKRCMERVLKSSEFLGDSLEMPQG